MLLGTDQKNLLFQNMEILHYQENTRTSPSCNILTVVSRLDPSEPYCQFWILKVYYPLRRLDLLEAESLLIEPTTCYVLKSSDTIVKIQRWVATAFA